MKYLSTLLITLCFSISAFANPVAANEARVGVALPAEFHRLTFDFHSAFLMNLHHFLFDAAIHENKLTTIDWQAIPSAAELVILQNAAAYYRANYAKKDLLFDKELNSIKLALSTEDARRNASGLNLPPALITLLNNAAPIYERCIWDAQNKSNQEWINNAKALDSNYGAEVQNEIERHLSHKFPLTPIRTDVVVETGDINGAYTDDQTVMPSARANYQGLAALEMLYHEASHTVVTDTLTDMIDARLKLAPKKSGGSLWHPVQFYTVGKVVQDVLKRRDNIEYQPYGKKNGVYQRGWSKFLPLIESTWQAHMDGKMEMSEAIDRILDQLPVQ